MYIKLDDIIPNRFQPREVFYEEALNKLADSIRQHGVIEPILVRPISNKYEIVAGERRYKASIMAGLEKIPAIIRDFSDQDMMEIALLENLQRENLNALEEALAYKKLLDELSLTQDALAKRLGKSRSHITNMLGLLNLPEEVKDKIIDGKISMGHARVLSKIEDAEEIKNLAERIVKEGLSVREIENITQEDKKYTKKNVQVRTRSTNSEYKLVEESLTEKFGSKTKIKNNKIEISFVNENDLNRILEIIGLE